MKFLIALGLVASAAVIPVEPILHDQPESIREIILREASVLPSPLLALEIATCESNLNPEAVGDAGMSRGIWQIHKKYWPEITDEQAFDPVWSTKWAIGKMKENKYSLWTCYKIVSGV